MKHVTQWLLLPFLLCFSLAQSASAQTRAPSWPWYNPWFFDMGCESYKVFRNEHDSVDIYRYNRQTDNFEWFQNLSKYAQKIDYFMEDVDKHFVSVTDESGHTVIYKWKGEQFQKWG